MTRAAWNTGSNAFGRDHSSAHFPVWSFCSVRRRAHPSGLSASVGWSGRRAPGDMNQRLRLLPIQVFMTSVSLAFICSGSVRREGAPVVGSRMSSTCPVRGLYVPNIFGYISSVCYLHIAGHVFVPLLSAQTFVLSAIWYQRF